MQITNALISLTESCYIGSVKETEKVIYSLISPFVDDIVTLDSGNIVATINGKTDYTIMLEAHMDEIGMIVTSVLSNGFVKAAKCGGIDKRVLPSSKVVIHGKNKVKGIFTSTPPHLATKEKSSSFSDFDEIMIDTGLDNAEQIISTGDFITFDVKATTMQNDYFTSKSLDNRSGCLALILCAEQIKTNGQPRNTIKFCFNIGEELGCRGVKTSAYSVHADEAIAVDVSFGLSPLSPADHCGVLGKGAMIGVSPVLSAAVSDKLTDIADESEIPYQFEIMGGRTSTDADEIAIIKEGVKCGLLSIPLRYMHTPIEVIKLSDIENTAKLLSSYALSSQKAE